MKTASRTLALGLALSCAAALVSACGGGGGGSSGASSQPPPPPPPPPPAGTLTLYVNVNPISKISWQAGGPFAATPLSLMIMGIVTGMTSSGTLYITVVADNPRNFFTVSNVTITGNTGQLNVMAAAPSSIPPGNYQGSITVTACLNDPSCKTGQLAGSPRVIPVSYDIGTGVDGDTVTPRVVAANTAGSVVLRGTGLAGATSVSFGSVAATSITVVNDTEIDASYPALPAGTYAVSINAGGISDTASLIAVSSPAFTQQLIPFPLGIGGQNPSELEYDAQRNALFVLFQSSTGLLTIQSTLLRYGFDGSSWGSPTEISMANLEAVHLSPDGTHLLGLVAGGPGIVTMIELDPVTLAQTNTTTASDNRAGDTPCGFALANDGNAIVSFKSGSGDEGIAFGTFSRTFTPMSDGGGCTPVASGNGTVLELGGSSNHEFLASSETVVDSGAQIGTAMFSGDFAGDKFLGDEVETQDGQILGWVVANDAIINAAGTRAYGYTANATTCTPTLSTFDLTATPTAVQYDPHSPQFPVLGTPITLPSGGCVNAVAYLLALTPDETTVFVARTDGVLVQPL